LLPHNPLATLPQTNMPHHTVTQGECISSIAARFGFADYRTIYDDGANADLRRDRPNPNQLLPGDVVFVPERDTTERDCAADQRHRFVVKRSKVRLRLVLKDADGPIANRPYVLVVDGQPDARGSTDGNGLIEQPVPVKATEGELRLQRAGDAASGFLVWRLRLGSLDPHDKVSGAQARLNNLGYFCGKVDGICGPRTQKALRSFQERHGLTQSGKVDAATAAALQSGHDEAG
jgi:hypothetical protein